MVSESTQATVSRARFSRGPLATRATTITAVARGDRLGASGGRRFRIPAGESLLDEVCILDAGPVEQLLGSSITDLMAVGPEQGRKVFTLQTLPACCDDLHPKGIKAQRPKRVFGVAIETCQA